MNCRSWLHVQFVRFQAVSRMARKLNCYVTGWFVRALLRCLYIHSLNLLITVHTLNETFTVIVILSVGLIKNWVLYLHTDTPITLPVNQTQNSSMQGRLLDKDRPMENAFHRTSLSKCLQQFLQNNLSQI